MSWFSVLKMPNPHGGKWADLTKDQYYELDDNNRYLYHAARRNWYVREIKKVVLPRKAGQAPPATDDQIRELREAFRFHSRQAQRMEKYNLHRYEASTKEDYYSIEEENNREVHIPRMDAVDARKPTTKEMYDAYSRQEKYQYWKRHRVKNKLASGAIKRMDKNPNYTPPFVPEPTEEYRDKHVHRDVSEYDDFTLDEKMRYHGRMYTREKRKGTKEKSNFHNRMVYSLQHYPDVKTYVTLEDSKNAT